MYKNIITKKLFLVSHVMPEPISSGGEKCVNSKLKWLSKYFTCSFVYNGDDFLRYSSYQSKILSYCVDIFSISQSYSLVTTIFIAFKNLVTFKPLLFNRFILNQNSLYSLIKEHKPEILCFEHLYSVIGVDLDKIKACSKNTKIMLIEHNNEYYLRKRLIESKKNLLFRSLISIYEQLALKKYIKRTYAKLDKVGFLSCEDLNKVAKDLGISDVFYTPPIETLKSDLKEFLNKYTDNKYNKMTFPFNPQYRPNVESLEKFLDYSFGEIIKLNRNVILTVTGDKTKFTENTINKLYKYDENISLVGYLTDQEFNTAVKNSDLLINPVDIGSGIKIKNLEALSEAVVVLTTTVGAEGIFSPLLIIFSDIYDGYLKALSKKFTDKDYYQNEKYINELIESNKAFYEIKE